MKPAVSVILLVWISKCYVYQPTGHPSKNIDLFNAGAVPRPGDIPTLNRKVFGGTRVSIQEHPYAVSIRRSYAHYLTGVIIVKNLVVTVAHPLAEVPIDELGVVVGQNYADRGTALLTVVLIVVHSDFDRYTLNADLALLRLYDRIIFKNNVKPILGLCEPSFSLSNKKAFVTGWGRCDVTGTELCLPRTSKFFPDEIVDPMLRTVSFQVPRPADAMCELYKRWFDISVGPGMLCVGQARVSDPVAPCMAVPGAPLVVEAKLVGLQSWGFACGYRDDLPVIYTDIRKYYKWIHQNVEILFNVGRHNLTQLFQATKSWILCKWLNRTRKFKAFHDHLDDELQPLEIDKMLAPLKGNVYDIRNFLSDGRYNAAKLKMYDVIRAMQGRSETLEQHDFKDAVDEDDAFNIQYDSDVVYSDKESKPGGAGVADKPLHEYEYYNDPDNN